MKHDKQSLASLQARARAAAARSTQGRVTVTQSAAGDAADGGDAATGVGSSAELWLYGTVGGYWWGFDSDDVAAALRELGEVEEILVRLHSFGGSALEGIAIANLLANHPANVRIVVDGLAASAASVIALAGSELIMSPGSQLMVHDLWTYTAGNASELRAESDRIEKQSVNYAETYAHRAGGTSAEWRERMLANNGEGTWFSAQEAVDAGLAARVANIASTTPPPPIPDPEVDLDDIDLAAAATWDLEVLIHPAARAAWASSQQRSTHKPPTASAGGSHNTAQKETAVAFSDEQLTTMRQELGLAGDADEATIVAALSEALAEQAEEPTAGTTTSVPEGAVIVEAAVLEELRANARQGAEARRLQQEDERDRAIAAAISDGRTTPARRDHWVNAWNADPEGAREQLASLEPGLLPVTELGHAATVESGQRTADDELYNSVYPPTQKEA